MLPEYYAIIGAIIGSLGGFFYLYETSVGKRALVNVVGA